MSHVKAGGSSKNIHNNAGARLGVKRFGGQDHCRPIFIGDDVTDEAGFIAVQSYGDTSNKKGSDIKGIGVKVGCEPSHAHYYVSDVSAVTALLQGLLTLCQS